MQSKKIKVIGIDPGSSRIGFGIIEKNGSRLQYLASGTIDIKPNADPTKNLAIISKAISEIVKKHKPDIAGVETVFFSKNKKTAIKVAEARGVVLNSLLGGGLKIIDIAPTKVKSLIAGSARASKNDVVEMIRFYIDLPDKKMLDDESDALAIAIVAASIFTDIDI